MMSGAATRATRIGSASARFLGTSSPTIIENALTTISESVPATAATAARLKRGIAERNAQQLRDRGLGRVAEQDRGERDAHLCAGELRGERRERAAHATRALALYVRGIKGDERELGRDKHRGAKRQEHARTDEQPGGHVRPRLWSSMGAATIPGRAATLAGNDLTKLGDVAAQPRV